MPPWSLFYSVLFSSRRSLQFTFLSWIVTANCFTFFTHHSASGAYLIRQFESQRCLGEYPRVLAAVAFYQNMPLDRWIMAKNIWTWSEIISSRKEAQWMWESCVIWFWFLLQKRNWPTCVLMCRCCQKIKKTGRENLIRQQVYDALRHWKPLEWLQVFSFLVTMDRKGTWQLYRAMLQGKAD